MKEEKWNGQRIPTRSSNTKLNTPQIGQEKFVTRDNVNFKSTRAKNRTLGFSITRPYENSLEIYIEDTIRLLQAQAMYEGATFSLGDGNIGGREAKILDIQNLSWSVNGKEYAVRQKYVVTFTNLDNGQHPVGLLFTAKKDDDEA